MRALHPGGIGIWRCWFLWREENRRKTLRARREPTTNSTHVSFRAGIEPGGRLVLSALLLPAPLVISKDFHRDTMEYP